MPQAPPRPFAAFFGLLALAVLGVSLPQNAAAQTATKSQFQLEDECAANSQASCVAAKERLKGTDEKHEMWYLTRRSCETGHAASCTEYGQILQKNRGASEAEVGGYFYRGCAGGDNKGCSLALDYVWGDKDSIIKDGEKRMFVAQKTCVMEESDGCALAGKLLGDQNQWGDALPFIEEACKLDKKSFTCGQLAEYRRNAKDEAKQAKRKADWEKKHGPRTFAFTAAKGHPLRAYVEETGDVQGAAEYIVTHMPGGRSLFEDSPLGDFLGELVVASGAKGLQGYSDYAITLMVDKNYWQYNPPASRLAFAEYQRRGRVAREQARRDEAARERERSEQARREREASAPYVGSAGPGGTYTPRQQVCTESYTGGGSGINGRGARIVRCQ